MRIIMKELKVLKKLLPVEKGNSTELSIEAEYESNGSSLIDLSNSVNITEPIECEFDASKEITIPSTNDFDEEQNSNKDQSKPNPVTEIVSAEIHPTPKHTIYNIREPANLSVRKRISVAFCHP